MKKALIYVIVLGVALLIGNQQSGIIITPPCSSQILMGAQGCMMQNTLIPNGCPQSNILLPLQNRCYPMAPTPSGLLGPAKQDAYGPGIWSDGTGRPFHWQTQDGLRVPFGKVKPDAFGVGIGMDEFGRPVKAVPGE